MIVFLAAISLCGVTAFVLPPAAGDVLTTNPVGDSRSLTNCVAIVTNDCVIAAAHPATNDIANTAFKKPSAFVIYNNSPIDSFDLEDWAESLISEKQGLYVKNGFILAVVKTHDDNENIVSFRRIQKQFMAYKMLREHFPGLPPKFGNLFSRVLIDEVDGDFGDVFVLMFKEQDVRSLCK